MVAVEVQSDGNWGGSSSVRRQVEQKVPCALGIGPGGAGDLLTHRDSVQSVRIGLRGRDMDWDGGLWRIAVDVLFEESEEFGPALLVERFASEHWCAIAQGGWAWPNSAASGLTGGTAV